MADLDSTKRRRLASHEGVLANEVTKALKTIGRQRLAAVLEACKDGHSGITTKDMHGLYEDGRKRFIRYLRVELDGGGVYECPVTRTGALLQELVACDRMQHAFATALAKTPCSPERPWKLIVACDEYTPGAQMTGRHPLKVMHLTYAFLEVGHLQCGDFWLSGLCASACCSHARVRSSKRFVCVEAPGAIYRCGACFT